MISKFSSELTSMKSGYLNAFKGDFKLEWVLEVAWVVQDYNITYMDLTRE